MLSPLQTATLQSAILNITSSVLAQLLTAYRTSTVGASSTALNPLGLHFAPIFQFFILSLLLTPPNFKWQQFLERKFPAYPSHNGKQKIKVDDEDGQVTLRKGHVEQENPGI